MKDKLVKGVKQIPKFIKEHRKLTIIVAAVVVVGVVAWLVLKPNDSQTQTAAPTVTALSRTTLEQVTTVTGTVASATSRSVNAKVSAEVVEVLVSEGDLVKAGQVLARLDTSDLAQDISNAKSDVAEAEAAEARDDSWASEDLTNSQNSYNSANDAYNSAQAAYLAAQAACTSDPAVCGDVDGKYQACKSAEGARNSAESSLRQAQRSYDTQVAKDGTKTARRQLSDLQSSLKDYTITAPVAGTITELNAVVGRSASGTGGGASSSSAAAQAAASAAASATASSALFVIEDVESFKAELAVAEYDALEIANGQAVRITADSIEDKTWDAKVTEVAPKAIDGNFAVTVAVLSPVENLKIGMSISADVITGSADNVFAVPFDAVVKNADGQSVVYAVEMSEVLGGRPALTANSQRTEIAVTTGLETDYYIEINGEGLKSGMMILNDPNGVNVVLESDPNEMLNMMRDRAGSMPSGGGTSSGSGMPSGGRF
jgi:multidrug efflux pump subunit AcrA (membrane-fusion protein)